jgi:hypothetical protein
MTFGNESCHDFLHDGLYFIFRESLMLSQALPTTKAASLVDYLAIWNGI